LALAELGLEHLAPQQEQACQLAGPELIGVEAEERLIVVASTLAIVATQIGGRGRVRQTGAGWQERFVVHGDAGVRSLVG